MRRRAAWRRSLSSRAASSCADLCSACARMEGGRPARRATLTPCDLDEAPAIFGWAPYGGWAM
eukprot:1598107-Prymnesium_polylepis.1